MRKIDLGSVIRAQNAELILRSFGFTPIFAMRVCTSIAGCMQMEVVLPVSGLVAGLRFNEILRFALCQSIGVK